MAKYVYGNTKRKRCGINVWILKIRIWSHHETRKNCKSILCDFCVTSMRYDTVGKQDISFSKLLANDRRKMIINM